MHDKDTYFIKKIKIKSSTNLTIKEKYDQFHYPLKISNKKILSLALSLKLIVLIKFTILTACPFKSCLD